MRYEPNTAQSRSATPDAGSRSSLQVPSAIDGGTRAPAGPQPLAGPFCGARIPFGTYESITASQELCQCDRTKTRPLAFVLRRARLLSWALQGASADDGALWECGVYAYGGSAAVSGMSRLAGSRLQHATRWSLSALSAGGRLLVGGANQALCATQRSICPPN